MSNVELKIRSNKTLETLRNFMVTEPVVFAEIAREGDKDIPRDKVTEVYAERHIESLITEPHSIYGISTNFVPDLATINGYTFRRKNNCGLTVATRRDPTPLITYTVVGLAHGQRRDAEIPFVIETLTNTESNNVILRKKLEPVRMLLRRKEIGYIVAAPTDSISDIYKETVQMQGGIVVEFPISEDEFRKGALKEAVI